MVNGLDRDLDREYLDALADAPAAIEVTELQPGTVVSATMWQRIIEQACVAFALQPDQILSTPYGIPPLPRPPEPEPDGTGRVPAGATVDVACHPVFWLPPKVAAQRAEEDADAWAVRLYLELIDRGAWDLDDNRPLDAFGVGGYDSTHELLVEDLQDYLAGEHVPWLIDYTLPPNPEATTGEIAQAAERVVAACRPLYAQVADAHRAEARDVVGEQLAVLDRSDAQQVLEPLRAAGVALQADPYQPQRQSDLIRSTQTVLASLALLDDARMTVLQAVDAERGGSGSLGEEATLQALVDAARQRQDASDRLVAQVIDDPGEATLRALWELHAGLCQRLTTEGRQAGAELARLAASRDALGLPAPAGELAAGDP